MRRSLLRRLLFALPLACALASPVARSAEDDTESFRQRIIVAVAEKNELAPGVGSTPRGYGGAATYRGGAHAASVARDIAREFGLRELSTWTIAPLRLRCMLYRTPAGETPDALLARLRTDRRVKLAQPVHVFQTLGSGSAPSASAAGASPYNDPYARLQHALDDIGAVQAQREADGDGIRVAVIDTGVDASHPDLAGRITERRDFVAGTHSAPDADSDRHGTEVAGIIAAVANNGIGIVGVAPKARLLSYQACWPLASGAEAAHCDSFTLAQALGAAIDADAAIINLSLSGPRDDLLEQLTSYALEHGAIVVGASPPDGSDAFPTSLARVIAVATDDGSRRTDRLRAPGRDILTLEPGGHYDYANGSSMAAAHVSGALALLLQHWPGLNPERAASVLAATSANGESASINVCRALRALGDSHADCASTRQ